MKPIMGEERFDFKGVERFYRGKVRDVYFLGSYIVMVATDRISAFDHILPQRIPYKGAVLNQLSASVLKETHQWVPNWLIDVPHPNISIGHYCKPFKVEVVVRGFLAGHAWRTYEKGIRELCGVSLPEGLNQNDPFPHPIVTPSTKAEEGHDEDISEEQIIAKGLASSEEWAHIKKRALNLFERGSRLAEDRGLILVDTKYEFGKDCEGTIRLIDEVHTPDSSRYFYAKGYRENQTKGRQQKQLSKEFVREWLMSNGFQGKEHQNVPHMPKEFVDHVSRRYIELYNQLVDQPFEPPEPSLYSKQTIEKIVNQCLENY